MRKLIKIALVALGIRAFLHWRKKRKERASAPAATPSPATDPADELRRKLAESRTDDGSTTPSEPAAAVDASVDARRDDVHEQGRATLDEMKSSSEA